MDEATFYRWLVIAWMILAAATFVALFFVTAPYGRFTRSGWGPRINARWGWILMEIPVLFTFLVIYGTSDRKSSPVSLVLLVFWVAHYLHRSLIYPFRLHGSRPNITVSIVAMGAVFNVGNGYLNGRYLFTLGPPLEATWLYDPRFVVGALLFWCGYALNQHSDRILIELREPGETAIRSRTAGDIGSSVAQLFGRDDGMGRLGTLLLEPRRAGLFRLDCGQPGSTGHQDPSLVPRAVSRLSGRPKGPSALHRVDRRHFFA